MCECGNCKLLREMNVDFKRDEAAMQEFLSSVPRDLKALGIGG